MSVWNVFKDRIAFQRYNCVACRKRVQRYNKFLNYQTFYKEIFKEIFEKNDNLLICTKLKHKKNFKKIQTFLLLCKNGLIIARKKREKFFKK